MLTIKTDDGSLYRFQNEEYTDYTITKEYVVVKSMKNGMVSDPCYRKP